MKKEKSEGKEAVNQHKRLAMGEKVTGMKHGGKAEHKAKGGMCHKEGGAVKGKKK